MLRSDEERVRRLLRGALAATLTVPLSPLACSSAAQDTSVLDASIAPVDASVVDASLAPDAHIDDAAETDAFELDAYVDWCEAGAPFLFDAGLVTDGACDYAVRSECGLPLGWRSDGYGTLDGITCIRMCPVSKNLLTGCVVYNGQDKLPDGSMYEFDAASVEGGAVAVECSLCGGGGRRHEGYRDARKVAARDDLGAYFAAMARLEAASVPAFLRLARELGAHGAPRSLVTAATRAAHDETRHTRLMTNLARRHGATPAPPDPAPFHVRSLEAVAVENAIEGCVRETYGAVVVGWQAACAKDTAIARALRRVADDEARHAALAWSVAAWADTRLDGRARRHAARERRAAWSALATELQSEPPEATVLRAGVPSARDALTLLANVRAAFALPSPIVTRTPPTRYRAAERAS